MGHPSTCRDSSQRWTHRIIISTRRFGSLDQHTGQGAPEPAQTHFRPNRLRWLFEFCRSTNRLEHALGYLVTGILRARAELAMQLRLGFNQNKLAKLRVKPRGLGEHACERHEEQQPVMVSDSIYRGWASALAAALYPTASHAAPMQGPARAESSPLCVANSRWTRIMHCSDADGLHKFRRQWCKSVMPVHASGLGQ